jgi:hypothetical protein
MKARRFFAVLFYISVCLTIALGLVPFIVDLAFAATDCNNCNLNRHCDYIPNQWTWLTGPPGCCCTGQVIGGLCQTDCL